MGEFLFWTALGAVWGFMAFSHGTVQNDEILKAQASCSSNGGLVEIRAASAENTSYTCANGAKFTLKENNK